MHSSTVQGHVVMSLVAAGELSLRIAVDLGYDPEDPYAVRFTFHLPGDTPVTWYFARELLVEGIGRPAGEGDVHLHPVGEEMAEVCIVLRSPDGDATLRSPAAPLVAFLARTDRIVPMGEEQGQVELEAQLDLILSGGCENAG